MSDFNAKTCDGPRCGKIKQEANHWIEIQEILWSDGLLTYVLGQAIDERGRAVTADPSEAMLYSKKRKDFCGEGCLYRYLSRELKLPAPAGEETKIGSD